jgi:hypothetical protein
MTSVSPVATFIGQDVGEAEGALTALLERVLASTNTNVSRPQYIALRILGSRGPAESPQAFRAYLASQPQLGVSGERIAALLGDLEQRGLITSGDGPTRLTPEGASVNTRLLEAVARLAGRLYAEVDPDDLATTHRVLVDVTARARQLLGEEL